ncbi:hypothetical protein LEN26_020756 [Aphanomyces euteiches]|nr:hypothetical protein LEN26_020756 [Aphanomyces euteiches]KAH9113253.1 hypothetical protein AeMF1_012526 [Aphanomyces euteiches]KAH9197871.1 hypothetical protein AeNC1_000148 [Aphanomyces euteiches]
MLISFVEVDGHLFYSPLAEFSSTYETPRLEGNLVVADPITAAMPLKNAKQVNGNIVLVQRGDCDFLTKTIHAQKAGALAVVVANSDEENPQLAFVMDAGQSRSKVSAKIPAVMAPFATAQHILDLIGQTNQMKLTVAIVLLDATDASAVLDSQERERQRRLREEVALRKQLEREKKQREAAMLLRSRLIKDTQAKDKFDQGLSDARPPPLPSSPKQQFVPKQPLGSNQPATALPPPEAINLSVINVSHAVPEAIAHANSCIPEKPSATGLLVLDVQYYCAMPHVGKFANMEVLNDYYFDRIKRTMVPNIQSLLFALRQRSMEIVYGIIESATKNGRDRSKAHKLTGIHVPKQSFDAKVLESVSPNDYDIVIPRTAISLFSTTNADYIFRNLGLECLVVVGVSTLGSLEMAVRDALDRGYSAIVVEDAVAFDSSDEHATVMRSVDKMGGFVVQTRDFLLELQAKCAPKIVEAVSM